MADRDTELASVDVCSWGIGALDTHVALVLKGVRPAAKLTILNEQLEEVEKTVAHDGLHMYAIPHDPHRTQVFIFRHPYLAAIIKSVIGQEKDKVFRAWCFGKLFGYSDEEIGRFLGKLNPKVLVKEAVLTLIQMRSQAVRDVDLAED